MGETETAERARLLMDSAPVDWEQTFDAMTEAEREATRRELEGSAYRAAMLAAYADKRAGYCGHDRGHRAALKAANRAGRIIWCKVFGYNSHWDLSV